MTRTAAALDRVVALIVGVVLVVVGVGALIWHAGLFTGLPQSITVPGLVDAMDTWWWRWAIAGVGLLCVGLALRWLVAHRPMGKVAPIRLHEAGDVGTITIDPADTLQRHPAVRTAKGKAITDRGTRTIELAVTAAHPDELAAVITAIDDACEHIAHAAGHAPLSVRATLHIKGGRELTRQRLRRTNPSAVRGCGLRWRGTPNQRRRHTDAPNRGLRSDRNHHRRRAHRINHRRAGTAGDAG